MSLATPVAGAPTLVLSSPRARRRVPWALAAHLASLAAAALFWGYLCRHLWFFGDEWDFLVDRSLSAPAASPHGIWAPHFEHWSTLPILLWRALFSAFGLSSYWPYYVALLIVAATVAHLVWRICVRAGTGLWVATLAAAIVAFMGAGAEDLGWAFQVGFLGSLAFGLGALLVADRPVLGGWRGIAVGFLALASLMCSTVGDAMFCAVGVAVVVLHGKAAVARVLAFPAGCYVAWWAGIGRKGLTSTGDHISSGVLLHLTGFLWAGFRSSLSSASGANWAGGLLVVLLAFAGARIVAARGQQYTTSVASALASLVFFAVVALGRDQRGDFQATSPRYVYIAVALLMPLTACALEAARAWLANAGRRLWPRRTIAIQVGLQALVVLALVWSLQSNIRQAVAWAAQRTVLVQGVAQDIRALAYLRARGVPDVAGPAAAPVSYSPDLTARKLAWLGRSGLFAPTPLTRPVLAHARAQLAVGLWSVSRPAGPMEVVTSGGARQLPAFTSCETTGGDERAALPGAMTLIPTGKEPLAHVGLRAPEGPAPVTIVLSARATGAVVATLSFQIPSSQVQLLDCARDDQLTLHWAGPGPLVICGLADPNHA